MSLISPAPTSTSTVRQGQSKVSWIAMPSSPCSTWHDPRSSIGTRCHSIERRGIRSYKCWNLREKSPAFLVWKAVSKTITTLLDDQFEHLDTRGAELMVEMFMVGLKPDKAAPTILFSCESKCARQKAMDLVEKKSLLAAYPGVQMAQCSRLPRPLALGDHLDSIKLLPAGVYAQGPIVSGLSGLSILIVGEDHAQSRRATIGGFLCINKEYYGLTVAHAFLETKSIPTEESDFEFSFYGEVDDSSDDEDEDLEMTSKGSVSSLSSRSGALSVESDEQNRKRHNSPLSSREPSWASQNTAHVGRNRDSEGVERTEDPILIGELYKTSSSDSSLDWALVKIDFNKLLLASLASDTSKSVLMRMICDVVNNTISTGYLAREFAIAAADVNVLIRSDSGLKPGTLSAATSWKRSANEKSFQELLRVKLDTGTFADGDCGSWILNPSNGRVYGHIVSGYPENGTAYLIPAWQIVVDIEDQIGPSSHVGFPLLEKMATIHSLFSEAAPGDSNTENPTSGDFKSPGQPPVRTPSHCGIPASMATGSTQRPTSIASKSSPLSPQVLRGKPQPAYIEDVDEDGKRISGTIRTAKLSPSSASTLSDHSSYRSIQANAKAAASTLHANEIIDSERRSPGTKRSAKEEKSRTETPHKSKSPAETRSKSTVSAVRPDKRVREPKLERRKSVSTNRASSRNKTTSRAPPAHVNAANTKRSNPDPSHYGITSPMATSSSQRPTPIVLQSIPLRPRAVIPQAYTPRPVNYHTSGGVGYELPFPTTPSYQPPLGPGQSYAPPPHVHYPPPSQLGYFSPPPPPLYSRPLSQRFELPDPVVRPSSAYGYRDRPIHTIHQKQPGIYRDGYAVVSQSGETRERISTPDPRTDPRGGGYYENTTMLPPPRPMAVSAATGYPETRGRYVDLHNTSPGNPHHRMPISYNIQPLRPVANSFYPPYGSPRIGVEVASSPGIRQAYYEQPADPNAGVVRGRSHEETLRAATTYQDDVASDVTLPLTAEMLRRQQRRGKARSRSASSTSRDKKNDIWDEGSSYKNSASTRTTRSAHSDDDNQDFRIKVKGGQARMMVGGNTIDVADGNEIQIQRQGVRGDSERSESGYGPPTKDNRRSRINRRQSSRSRKESPSSYSRISPQYQTGSYF